MSWEAFRLTSKSPSDVLHVLGPHGVDDLIRKMMDTCWRESPEQDRSFKSVRAIVADVFGRNMQVWSRIKKPTPEAFFQDLLPHAADGHMRQALVLCWMMLPRAGGRDFSDVKKIVTAIFERNMLAWEADNNTFTGTKRPKAKKKPSPVQKRKSKPTPVKSKKS